MSEPRLISPMLDNFLMGEPISDHDGVRCCPAIRKDCDDKYMVKIISVPASQTRLDALLLTGAFKNTDDAQTYFRNSAKTIENEYQILQTLSEFEGFIPYEDCQVVSMDNAIGYDIYMLSPYRKSLGKQLCQNNISQRDAVKIGIDLCAALAACRRSGFLYVDLKPDNVYVTGDSEYKIGDLGFLRLDSLKFATLSDMYRSRYTAPEISDSFAPINTTIDVYAAGLILYQIFNGNILPNALYENFIAPQHADAEMTEIIRKAIMPNPADRWQTPVELGQALVAYMQDSVADDPVYVITHNDPNSEEHGLYEQVDGCSHVVDSEYIAEKFPAAEDVTESMIYAEDENGNFQLIGADSDAISESISTNITYDEISTETSGIMTYADELLAHPAPEPVVVPEKVEIPTPAPIVAPIECADEQDNTIVDSDNVVTENSNTEEETTDISTEDKDDVLPVGIGRLMRNIAVAFVILLLLIAGFFYYRNVYTQEVSISLDAQNGSLSVSVQSEIADNKLIVVCTDTNGNRFQQTVSDGAAVFTQLLPNSTYTVEIETTGFHKLIGKISETYTTPAQINITQFNAVAGIAEGSVKLSFTAEPNNLSNSIAWKVKYSSVGENEKEAAVVNGYASISGLTVGKEYTFNLVPMDNIDYIGMHQIKYTPQMLVRAQNLTYTYFQNGKLTVLWSAPEGANIGTWVVRCYNDKGYDKTLVTSDLTVTFSDVITTDVYTIEVAAEGMPQSEKINISKYTVNITNFNAFVDTPEIITVTWDSDYPINHDGWILKYSINGGVPQTITGIAENAVSIMGCVSNAEYTFVLSTADEAIMNGEVLLFTTPEIQELDLFGFKMGDLNFDLCDTATQTETKSFRIGKNSYLKVSRDIYGTPPSKNDDVEIVTLIKDSTGTVLLVDTVNTTWKSMWQSTYYNHSIPALPQQVGGYTLVVYLNDQLAFQTDFSMI